MQLYGIYVIIQIISTHAPTRGATLENEERDKRKLISTHAPTRGATARGHEERVTKTISTHAPTRGATARDKTPERLLRNFYSRPYARGDGADDLHQPEPGAFLLTPLREGRQQFFTKPQVDLYDKLLKIHIFQINTFCILQHSFENFKDYFVGSARTSRKNVYGKGWR